MAATCFARLSCSRLLGGSAGKTVSPKAGGSFLGGGLLEVDVLDMLDLTEVDEFRRFDSTGGGGRVCVDVRRAGMAGATCRS
jgi:hypothetical protein